MPAERIGPGAMPVFVRDVTVNIGDLMSDYDDDFDSWVEEIVGEEDQDKHDGEDETLAADEAVSDEMSAQDESVDDGHSEGEMPNDQRDASDDEDTKTDTKPDTKPDDAIDDAIDDGFVPKSVVKKVRHERREIARERDRLQRELDAAQAKLDANNQQLSYYQKQATDAGADEYTPPPTELTDDLLERVRDGDTDAIAQALAIRQREQQEMSKEVPVDTPEDGHWTTRVTDEVVIDQLESWSDAAEAGDKRGQAVWAKAVEVSNQVLSDPANQALSPDEIGAKIVEQTKQSFTRSAVEATVQPGEDQMPESLSTAGGSGAEPDNDLLGLEGDELIAALDAMVD